jgi:hypothetical protein
MFYIFEENVFFPRTTCPQAKENTEFHLMINNFPVSRDPKYTIYFVVVFRKENFIFPCLFLNFSILYFIKRKPCLCGYVFTFIIQFKAEKQGTFFHIHLFIKNDEFHIENKSMTFE